MSWFKVRSLGLFLVTAALVTASGCAEKARNGVSSGGPSWNMSAENPVPGIDHGTATVTTLNCCNAEGVTVVIWSDLSSGAQSSAKATDQLAREEGSHTGEGGRKVGYTIETTDGKSATITLEGAQFSTAAGNLFLISTQAEKPRIAQINVTIDDFPNEPEKIMDYAQKHEDITKFFVAAMPKPVAETE